MKLSSIRPITVLICKELVVTAMLLLGVSFVVFIIIYLSPGDPFGSISKDQATLGTNQVLKETDSASLIWITQYLAWLGNILEGNFGASIRSGLPVLQEVIRVGINTLYLTIGSMLVTLFLAIPIAVFSARRGLTFINWTFTILTYVLSALPVFWLGYIVIYISMHQFGLFPLAFGTGSQKWNWLYFLLPVFVLGISNGTISEVVRFLREEMARVFSEDYIRTARAKGASIWKHSFKEGFLIPITEIVASKIPFILGGAVVVEQVFNWPGMGRFAANAVIGLDFNSVMGFTIIVAIIYVVANLIVDLLYAVIDPRVKLGGN